jgi:hypothetical protein
MAAKSNNRKNSGNRKFQGNRHNIARSVVSRRRKGESWASIASSLEVAPRTVRRIYDEKVGTDAHFGLLEGKGGRIADGGLRELPGSGQRFGVDPMLRAEIKMNKNEV